MIDDSPLRPDRSMFAVLGGFAGLFVTGAAAIGFVYLAGDLGNDARWLRVGTAALIGAGMGAYLGNTRRQFILDCAARFARPVTAICRAGGLNRGTLRSVLQLSLAGLIVTAWLVWIVGPDWRLHRIIDRLQSTDTEISYAAVRELKLWSNGGIAALDRERNQMLLGLLNDQRAAVRARALLTFNECEPGIARVGSRSRTSQDLPRRRSRLTRQRRVCAWAHKSRPCGGGANTDPASPRSGFPESAVRRRYAVRGDVWHGSRRSHPSIGETLG